MPMYVPDMEPKSYTRKQRSPFIVVWIFIASIPACIVFSIIAYLWVK